MATKAKSPDLEMEDVILEAVELDAGSVLVIVSRLKSRFPEMQESMIRHVIWRLVDKGKLGLSDDWKLQIQ